MSVAVVGSGPVGLALATQYALSLRDVIVHEPDPAGIETKARYEPDLWERIVHCREHGYLRVTGDLATAVAGARVVVVFTPVDVVDGQPSYRELEAVTHAVGEALADGALVSFEVHLVPGDVRSRLVPLLEKGSGRRAGVGFFVTTSPPRATRGHVFADLSRFPTVLGALDESSLAIGREFYVRIGQTVLLPTSCLEAAELCGLAEHLTREVNTGLAHELAGHAVRLGLDLAEVHFLANTQPFFPLHEPGMQGLTDELETAASMLLASAESPLVAAARRRNDELPSSLCQRLAAEVGGLDGQVIAFVVDDAETWRSRRSERLLAALLGAGAEVDVHPVAHRERVAPAPPSRAAAIVIATDRIACSDLDPAAFPACRVLLDATDTLRRRAVVALGWRHLGVGS